MKTNLDIWSQRNLTLFGKNVLINSLSTSLFIPNAQIENPRVDFIRLVGKIHKGFLWTRIASYKDGGMYIYYRDLNCFIIIVFIRTHYMVQL